METNLLWMAGSRAPPVNYTLSAQALPKQYRALMKEKANMMRDDFTWRYDKDPTFKFHIPLCIPLTEVHSYHREKYSNAVIIGNKITGMDNLSLLVAQPTQFSLCAGWRKKINQRIICSNFIFSPLGWPVIIIITVIITHLALIVFVVHQLSCPDLLQLFFFPLRVCTLSCRLVPVLLFLLPATFSPQTCR